MSFRRLLLVPLLTAAVGGGVSNLAATETENLGLRLLPAPQPPAIDGTLKGWDLSGGIFACGDVENQRTNFGTWMYAMYDAQHLYLLAHFVDPTPLNNPGQVEADYGFAGDCLQFRVVAGAGTDAEKGRASHWTCWQGRGGKHVMNVEYGIKFDQGGTKDAQAQGAKQAFAKDADGGGYVQVMAIPWGLIGPESWTPKTGDTMRFTIEPNFTVGTNGRLTNKDIFSADRTPDRVFTFMSNQTWGAATFAKAGTVEPSPVRLSDRREFAVSLIDGRPKVDWTGLIKQVELKGHKSLSFEMPFDGYISLNLFAADGSVARQLLNTAFYTKGKHAVKWDGLGTYSWRNPGDPVAAGTYTWEALVHPGLDLKLVGWAANAGAAPWDGASGRDNWGGDHGEPNSVATLGDRVFLGWTFAEAGKALVACDTDGKVIWKNSRQGMSGCRVVTATINPPAINPPDIKPKTHDAFVFGLNGTIAYRLTKDGSYAPWPGKDTPDLKPFDVVLNKDMREGLSDEFATLSASWGTLFSTTTKGDALIAIDADKGILIRVIKVPAPGALCAINARTCYVVSENKRILHVDIDGEKITTFAELPDVQGIARAKDGTVYVSVGGSTNQVQVFDKDGKALRIIGRAGGRPLLGKWDPSGLKNPVGLAVDAKGTLWVAENDNFPRRFSTWDTTTGAFKAEYLGPATYGALGGSICPADPHVMVGQGCEWRIDPVTGKARVLAVITRDGMENSRFATGTNGRTYLFTAGNWAFNVGPINIFERLGDGQWKKRSEIFYRDKDGKDVPTSEHGKGPAATMTMVWADANDDGKRDANEVSGSDGIQVFSRWYMNINADLTLYAGDKQFRSTGFTACGAPTWDLAKPVTMPAAGLGSADGKLVLRPGDYGEAHTRLTCFDIASGKPRWWYPDNFNGVHGSHSAPPPVVGLIRGSYGPCAAVRLPEPIGNAWVLATNVGEWHLLTERGFYLSRLFQGDQLKMKFPEMAVPGVLMNDCPPGMGGEDFGGSATVAKDGKLYLQAGKTAFWNVVVDGLNQVKSLKGGSITISEPDIALARQFKEQALQTKVGIQRLVVKQGTPSFTGNIEQDFKNHTLVSYDKGDGTRVRSALAIDATTAYLAWEVQDRSPWVNGAKVDDSLYWGGDTVDFQLGSDPAADPARGEAVKGDLRLSIGSLQGKDVAVVFRQVADTKAPRTFSSGVIKEFIVDSVVPLPQAKIVVTKRGDGYTVEAAIPLADLGLSNKPGLKLRGDFGVTFGNQAGDRTRLRSYWSNQKTGIVDDVVFELKLEPKFWGEIVIGE
ncbi:MAG: hypothetical protein H0W78_11480 [Planctomycetes bacterium]|nr:hypothetical protein [Planctomycetota bacterium]